MWSEVQTMACLPCHADVSHSTCLLWKRNVPAISCWLGVQLDSGSSPLSWSLSSFRKRSSVCVHISPCHLHHDEAAQPINLSTAFFCLMLAFITHLSSMSDHLGEKKLGYRPGTFTILAHWPLSFFFFLVSLSYWLLLNSFPVECFSSLFNFLHHCRNTKL